MDVKLINPFLSATLNVLETMAFIKAEAGKPYLKKDNIAKGDVSGVVGLTGGANGTVSVTFDEACILNIVSSMFDYNYVFNSWTRIDDFNNIRHFRVNFTCTQCLITRE